SCTVRTCPRCTRPCSALATVPWGRPVAWRTSAGRSPCVPAAVRAARICPGRLGGAAGGGGVPGPGSGGAGAAAAPRAGAGGRALERGRGSRRPLGWREGPTGLAFLAVFQPFHRRNAERFRAGKRHAVALLAQLRGTRVHRGTLVGEQADVDRQLHRAASMSRRWGHCAILSSTIESMRASCEESTACT